MQSRFLRCTIMTILIGVSSFASGEVTVTSRNMPTDCEFVHNVHSEINITWQSAPVAGWMEYELFHEYDSSWKQFPAVPFKCQNGIDKCTVTLSLESMSTARHSLYRTIRFQFVEEGGQPMTARYQATFGREFGERCFSNPDQTPFRTREVFELEGGNFQWYHWIKTQTLHPSSLPLESRQ